MAHLSSSPEFRRSPGHAVAAMAAAMLSCILATGAVRGCEARAMQKVTIDAIEADGDLVAGARVLRLQGIVWPAATAPEARAQARRSVAEALKDAEIGLVPLGGPDRWGREPVHLFVREAGGELAPFWLQAGMVEAGLVKAWPDPEIAPCWDVLRRHERVARAAGRGLWAEPDAASLVGQEATPAVGNGGNPGENLFGRKITTIAWVRQVREGRGNWFINLDGSGMAQLSIMIDRRMVRRFKASGVTPQTFAGRRIAVRAVLVAGPRPRQLVERPEQVEILE